MLSDSALPVIMTSIRFPIKSLVGNLFIKTYMISDNSYKINIIKCNETIYLKALVNNLKASGKESIDIELPVEFRPKTIIKGQGMNDRTMPEATVINPCTAELSPNGVIQNVNGLYLIGSNIVKGHFEFIYECK